jgi:hypothetical protein
LHKLNIDNDFHKKETFEYQNQKCEEELYSRREHEKIQRMTKTLGCLECTLEDFSKNLNLLNEGWDPQRDFNSFVFTHEELKATFGKREHNDWKARPNELLIHSDCARLQKLYELVYGHAPTNNDYLGYFFVWLVGIGQDP